MEQVLGTLRSALGMKVANDLVNDDITDLRRLAGSNPMRELAQTPKNYLGAFDGVNPASIPGGHWYFDRHSRMLIYRVRNRDYFSGGLGMPPRAGFTIRSGGPAAAVHLSCAGGFSVAGRGLCRRPPRPQ